MKSLVFVLMVCSGILAFDFAIADEIHKHDGSILKGQIIEEVPDEFYKIRLADGSILVVKADEVDNVILKTELKKHHIGIQVGIFNPSSDVIEFRNLDLDVEGNTGLGILNYRYSLNPFIDFALDIRAWAALWIIPLTSQEIELTSGFVGLGIRLNGMNRTKGKKIIPYLQGNIYSVQEELKFWTLTENGIGFGLSLSGGIDLKISHLISIPIEATYIGTSGDDIDDLSGFGLSVGVNFNF
jgi:hypothetical protein